MSCNHLISICAVGSSCFFSFLLLISITLGEYSQNAIPLVVKTRFVSSFALADKVTGNIL